MQRFASARVDRSGASAKCATATKNFMYEGPGALTWYVGTRRPVAIYVLFRAAQRSCGRTPINHASERWYCHGFAAHSEDAALPPRPKNLDRPSDVLHRLVQEGAAHPSWCSAVQEVPSAQRDRERMVSRHPSERSSGARHATLRSEPTALSLGLLAQRLHCFGRGVSGAGRVPLCDSSNGAGSRRVSARAVRRTG